MDKLPMLGEGTSKSYSFPKPVCNKATGSRRMRGNLDSVIIDVDDDGDDDVIIIDVHETSRQGLRGSNVIRQGKRFPVESIIHIDDDESHYADHSDISAEDDGDSDGTPRTSPAPNCMPRSEDADVEDCGVRLEKGPAFKLSKCKNMYKSKSPPRNRYGLSELESDPESDSSDCEVIEGSSSELREQWEKVCVKKKSCSFNKGSGPQNQFSPCSSQSDTEPNAEVGNGPKQNSEDPVCSRGKRSKFQDGSSSDLPASEDGFIGGYFNPWIDVDFAEANDYSRLPKAKSRNNSAFHRKNDVRTSEQTCKSHCDFQCASRLHDGRFDFCGQSPRSIHRSNKKVIGTRSCFQHGKQKTVEDFFGSPVKPNLDSDKRPSGHDNDKDSSLCKDQASREIHNSNPPGVYSMEEDSKLSEATSGRDNCSNEVQCEMLGSDMKDKLCSGALSFAEGLKVLDKLISTSHDGKDSIDASSGGVISTQNDIINERERIKETDEYKRAVEEEWAARQEQLKIQAEEAKRLKKRRKAETLRILDMERRQKQRVEEVRETQRKDEENLNMKENLRSEVRKQLYRLETTSIDMASLLRGLGIHVDGGYRPSLQEVNAAYKRALLKFHPDRASRNDIRQQVEAEEKFKLISRMKEKLMPS